MTHFIKTILQLEDPNLIFDADKTEKKAYKGIQSLFFYAKLCPDKACCPHCQNNSNLVRNGSKASRITLVSVSGLPAYLILKKQRYVCKACQKSFTAQSPIVDRDSFISNRVKQLIMDKATEVLTKKYIAKISHVSDHTVARVIKEKAKPLRQRPLDSLPKHLAFDEFKSVKSVENAMSFIMINNETHRLVDIVADRKISHLSDYFLKFSLEDRQAVETVCIDMYQPYMRLIESTFPNAKIILDRFHLIQALNRELNRYRIKVMNGCKHKNPRLYNKFKRYWRLFLLSPDQLKSGEYMSFPLFDWMTNTDYIVEYLLSKDESLKATYYTVHQLSEAIRNNRFDQFQTVLHLSLQSKKLGKGLKRVLRSFKKYLKYVGNTFDYPHISNGPIEGFNNKIKVLKRQAYGYRNYKNFRDRILLTTKLYLPKQEKTQVV